MLEVPTDRPSRGDAPRLSATALVALSAPPAVAFAAFLAVLHRYTGADDLVLADGSVSVPPGATLADLTTGATAGAVTGLAAVAEDGRLVLQYDPSLFDAATIERLGGHVGMMLAGGGPIAQVPLLTPAEVAQLHAANDTAVDYPFDGWVPALIAAQAARTPDAVALVSNKSEMSYFELDRRTNRLANHLRANGVTTAAIQLERSFDLVIAIVAVLKAGAATCRWSRPIPAARLEFMRADSGASVLITDQTVAEASPEPPQVEVTGDGVAYVIYTSGSTGQPKGVPNTHAGLLNRLQWMQEAYHLGPGDAVLQKTPCGFDVSVWEFLWPLIHGARLVIARPGGHRDPHYLPS